MEACEGIRGKRPLSWSQWPSGRRGGLLRLRSTGFILSFDQGRWVFMRVCGGGRGWDRTKGYVMGVQAQ